MATMKRRDFLKTGTTVGMATAIGATAATAASGAAGAAPFALPAIKPRRLAPGDTVGVVAPATAVFQDVEADIARESLEALGLKVQFGRHLRDRHGYLAGEDKARAEDINRFFADPSIAAVLPIRGGWGSARVLPYLDFEVIKRNPKVLMGFSDITSSVGPSIWPPLLSRSTQRLERPNFGAERAASQICPSCNSPSPVKTKTRPLGLRNKSSAKRKPLAFDTPMPRDPVLVCAPGVLTSG